MTPQRVLDRIESRVEKVPGGCWVWTGALTEGYGRIGWVEDGVGAWGLVHRLMYAAHVGPINEGLDVDHLCHDPSECQPQPAKACPHRRCCNPDHLQAVSRRENLLRGGTVTAARAAITECPRGHAYTEGNTLVDKLGRRNCRECTYERNRAYYHANRERRAAYNKAWREKQRQRGVSG